MTPFARNYLGMINFIRTCVELFTNKCK